MDDGIVTEAVAQELEQDRGEDSDCFASPRNPRSLVARSGALKTKRRELGLGAKVRPENWLLDLVWGDCPGGRDPGPQTA